MLKNLLPFIAVACFGLLYSSIYIIPEGQQGLVKQFGRIISKPITEAGPGFKLPFVQKVSLYEKRILTWDGDDEQIPTKDKKYIIVDTTARWKIEDVITFAKTLINEDGARSKLNGIIDGITRDTISNHQLVEAVRNTNQILEDETAFEEEEVIGEIEKVEVGRDTLSRKIITRAQEKLKEFGIKLIDVQLRGIAYERSVEAKVYERMISERKRIAEKFRSIGKGEQAKILGRIDKELKEIESAAYRKSQEIKGVGEAESIALYADAARRNPGFFEFLRMMDAYEKSLPKKANFILSTNSEFLRLLQRNP